MGLARRLFEERQGREVESESLAPLTTQFTRRLLGAEWSPDRARFLAHLLEAAQEGHLCIDVDETDEAIRRGAGEWPGVRREGNRFYLSRLYSAEQRVKEELRRLLGEQPAQAVEVQGLPDQLLDGQRRAIERAAAQSFSIIAGGPGTGKTFTAAHLIEQVGRGVRVAVAAPTGKAAGNLQRALGGSFQVTTLHALLGLPRRPVRQLGADLIVVDEAAMIDVKLLGHLLSAVKPGARLVLMGDAAQLPPIEAGGLFGEMALHPDLRERVTELTECVRTDKRELLDLAAAVREGDVSRVLAGAERIRFGEIDRVLEASRQGVRILTALRRGPWGSEALNGRVAAERSERERPIVITRNDHRLALFNGEEGVLVGDRARFGDREFSRFALPSYEYAYCLSVHKSQGSEFDSVLFVAPPGAEMFGREMLYTALTRAKRSFSICAPDEVLEAMLARKGTRLSGFSAFDFKQL